MSIPVVCPGCRSKATAPDESLGKDIRCPKCGCSFLVCYARAISEPPPLRTTPQLEPTAEPAPETSPETAHEEDFPQPRRPNVLLLGSIIAVAIAFGVVLLIIVLATQSDSPQAENAGAGRGRPPAAGASNSSPVARTDPIALFQEFEANALQADLKYKGKFVTVSGRSTGVQAGENGAYFLGFGIVESTAVSWERYNQKTPLEKKWFNEGYPPNVHCYISPDQKSAFASIAKDQGATVVGRVQGMRTAGGYWKERIVVLEDCSLAGP